MFNIQYLNNSQTYSDGEGVPGYEKIIFPNLDSQTEPELSLLKDDSSIPSILVSGDQAKSYIAELLSTKPWRPLMPVEKSISQTALFQNAVANRNVHLHLWRETNREWMKNGSLAPDEKEIYTVNVFVLLDILKNSASYSLIRAELFRNIEQFHFAIKMLREEKTKSAWGNAILQKCFVFDPAPFELNLELEK